MRILLLGEYSNVHSTLAEGLKQLGHNVTVASNGDFWKNYPRDINLKRHNGHIGGPLLAANIYRLLPRFRNFDIVQLINPMFVELKAMRNLQLFEYLRRHNSKIVLCGYGMDYYWVNTCCRYKHLRYSDFNIGDKLRADEEAINEKQDWIGTNKELLNRFIAQQSDAIITGLYEYYSCYEKVFPRKTSFIPFPINIEQNAKPFLNRGKLKIFIGINTPRNHYKGTDIMLMAAKELLAHYPQKVELRIARSVPFSEYRQMMLGSDVILDQLYSYTPAMNALEAMSHGIICVGGGEPENYEIIGENVLKPIINVLPTKEDVYQKLEKLIDRPQLVNLLKQESIEYIRKHHDYIKVAKQYEMIYKTLFNNTYN
jgi:glycosyltransferase involved in cell wall biosynthesis